MGPVRPFFEAYARAFAAYDADAIAATYVTPCLLVRDGVPVAVPDAAAVTESVEALLALHRAWDIQTVRAKEVTLLEQGPGHALARVDWRLGRTRSRMAWTFATTYALVPGDDWLIASAITHDAPF